MISPPFCPNVDCSHHRHDQECATPPLSPTEERQWYAPAGYYSTKAFGRVRRFRCRSCGQYFSAQTFSLDYFIKRPVSYETVFRRIVGSRSQFLYGFDYAHLQRKGRMTEEQKRERERGRAA